MNDGTTALIKELEPISMGVHDVAVERFRQISEEGWTTEHDDQHDDGQLAQAGSCYADLAYHQAAGNSDEVTDVMLEPHPFWPWDPPFWKPKDPRRNLVRAAALIIAEIDRLDREAARDE